MIRQCLVALALVCAPAWSAGIGVIDVEAVLSASDRAQSARAEWQAELAPTQARLARLLEQGQLAESRLQTADVGAAERSDLVAEMTRLREQMAALQQQAQALLAAREQSFLETNLPILESLVIELADAQNLELVVNAEAVVWGRPSVNLSDDLLVRFNATP
ncbi:OmpH family outer membrane protein [Litorivicinus lipolyticus]|uniref:OmpH family outer membrane protein n=1 Tax=Litorivicinus lipolyticus TaxID=418701 RepID=UPI003B5C0EAF